MKTKHFILFYLFLCSTDHVAKGFLVRDKIFRNVPIITIRAQSNTSVRKLSSRPADDFITTNKVTLSVATIDHDNIMGGPLKKATKTADLNVMQETTSAPSEVDENKENNQFTPFQLSVRASVALTTVGYLINAEPLDNAISELYSFIHNWDAASTPLFEAKVAVMGFLVPIVCFSSLHLLLGKEKTKASRFDGQLPTKPFEWLEFENWNLAFNPVSAYLGSIWIYHQFVHPHAGLPELAPTFGVFAVELLFGVWLYDLLFFPLHYLMHRSKFGPLRKCHGYHHRVTSHTLNSLETVQHSYIDGFLQVAVNVLVQQISPFGGFGHKHYLSRLAHNIVVTYLLTEAHSGYNLPWMSHRIFPELLGGSERHETHHHDGRVYYQQYFKYLDDFFGFTEDQVSLGPSKKKDGKELQNKDEAQAVTTEKSL